MKKFIYSLLFVSFLVGCSPVEDNNTIHVVTSFYPMKDILENIESDLNAEGYQLKVSEITDSSYKIPNELVANKEADANMIQHQYFLSGFVDTYGWDLEVYLPIYYSYFGIYSTNYTSPSEVENGTSIIIPNDKFNIRRSLLLLDSAGLITLKDHETKAVTIEEISAKIDNPKNFKFVTVGLTVLAATYKNSPNHLVTMYPTYAKTIGLEGNEQKIYDEPLTEETKKYAITLSGLKSRRNEPKIIALIDALNSEKTAEWINNNYGNAAQPALNLQD